MLNVPVSACQPMRPGCAAVWRSYCWLTAVLVAPFGCFRARDCLRCEAGVVAAAPACAFVISKAGGRRRGHTQGGAAQLLTALHPTCAWCSSTDESFCPKDVGLPWLTHMRLSFFCVAAAWDWPCAWPALRPALRIVVAAGRAVQAMAVLLRRPGLTAAAAPAHTWNAVRACNGYASAASPVATATNTADVCVHAAFAICFLLAPVAIQLWAWALSGADA